MTHSIIAFVTCGSREEAGKLAEALVGERLAACVNVLSSVESCYRWQNQVKWDRECLLLIKTTADHVDSVRERVLQLHSYDVPEFVAVSVETGSVPYLDWIADSVD